MIFLKEKFGKLKNKHLGEECYIFGDGVSLKYFNLNKFNDKPSIVSNNFIFHKHFNKLNNTGPISRIKSISNLNKGSRVSKKD